MKTRSIAICLACLLFMALAAANVGASTVLQMDEMSKSLGGGSPSYYGACMGYDFCNNRDNCNGTPDGQDCSNTCSSSSRNYACAGQLSTDYCVTAFDQGGCGYKYNRGVCRSGHCQPDDKSYLTETPCNKAFCDTTP